MINFLVKVLFKNRLGLKFTLSFSLIVLFLLASNFWISDFYNATVTFLWNFFGVGYLPSCVWALVLILTIRHKPSAFFTKWRFWASGSLILTGSLGLLSGFTLSIENLENIQLGGLVGNTVRVGNLTLVSVGTLTSFLLLFLGIFITAPKRSTRAVLQGCLKTIRLCRQAIPYGMSTLRGLIFILRQIRSLRQQRFQTKYEDIVPTYTKQDNNYESDPVIESDGISTGSESRETSLLETSQPTPVQTSYLTDDHSIATKQSTITSRPEWVLPSLNLFNNDEDNANLQDDHTEVGQAIKSCLLEFGVPVEIKQINPGPTVTMFGLTPGWITKTKHSREKDQYGNLTKGLDGKPILKQVEEKTRVKVDTILAREKDLALALAVPSLRFQAPVPGESLVGVEVPNAHPQIVSLPSIMRSANFTDIVDKKGLPIALGKGTGGDDHSIDLTRLPHLLIAGSTGSGKSVCINSIITSLLTHISPWDARMMLIDPKRVELTAYNGIPHLVTPVITDLDNVVSLLKGVIQEMFSRYKRMEAVGAKNIQTYNKKSSEPIPYFILCIDELADLMMTAPYDVEKSLTRLAQLGRATGIHLIVATQRPSVDVITGLIKANFPSRISFAVASQTDSRTILDSTGAEKLLGRGDMLFVSPTEAKAMRIQGTFVDDDEIDRVVTHWTSQQGPLVPEIHLEQLSAEFIAEETVKTNLSHENDELFDQAIELANRSVNLSTSLLQRRLRIGYPRAARLMDQLEDSGMLPQKD